jgi:hypothetical protein
MENKAFSIEQSRLLCQIAAHEKQVLRHEKEAARLIGGTAQEHSRLKAAAAEEELLKLLKQAESGGMDTEGFPLVHRLSRKYAACPRD